MRGGWGEDAIGRGVRFAEGVWEVMWDPKHKGPKEMKGDGGVVVHPKTRPEIVGGLLFVYAAKAKLFGGGGGLEQVEKFVRLLLSTWENVDLGDHKAPGDQYKANAEMVTWVPV